LIEKIKLKKELKRYLQENEISQIGNEFYCCRVLILKFKKGGYNEK